MSPCAKNSDDEALSNPEERAESDADEDMGSEAGDDAMSELSENYDIFETNVFAERTWLTIEDDDLCIAETVAASMRASPLEPADQDDAETIASKTLPAQHCAFTGCTWTSDGTHSLEEHVMYSHFLEPGDGLTPQDGRSVKHWRP